jgi:hypothetical protein
VDTWRVRIIEPILRISLHAFIGYLFGLHNSNVYRLFKLLEPLMEKKITIKKDRTQIEHSGTGAKITSGCDRTSDTPTTMR